MACPVSLRIFFNEDDASKITLTSGLPNSVEDLVSEIKTIFGLSQQFRLQYRDADFGNEYGNLVAISDIQDKATLKVVFCHAMKIAPTFLSVHHLAAPVRLCTWPRHLAVLALQETPTVLHPNAVFPLTIQLAVQTHSSWIQFHNQPRPLGLPSSLSPAFHIVLKFSLRQQMQNLGPMAPFLTLHQS